MRFFSIIVIMAIIVRTRPSNSATTKYLIKKVSGETT